MKHKKSNKPARRLHVKIAFHPIMLFGILLVGVVLVLATFRAFAQESFVVTAILPTEPLTQAATIASPSDQDRTTQSSILVSGTCPADSYVRIFRNSTAAGMAMCNTGQYSLTVSLAPNANTLRIQAYDLTDQPGPATQSIQVFYDEPVTPPATPTTPPSQPPSSDQTPVEPTKFVLLMLDKLVEYENQTDDPLTSNRPVFAGLAPAGTNIDIEVHSKVVYCQTYANGSGYWRCALNDTLEPGDHTAKFTATLPSGEVVIIPDVEFHVADRPTAPAPQTAPVVAAPLALGCDCKYSVQFVGKTSTLPINIVGGAGPYTLVIDWGDGTLEYLTGQKGGPLTLEHTYKQFSDGQLRQYQVSVAAYDATGTVSYLESALTVRNPAYVAATSQGIGITGSWLSWLWPVYAVIILMLLSFWLGERQELAVLAARHKKTVSKRHKKVS